MIAQHTLFQSLRFRLLAPLIVASVSAAAAVAVGSYWLGDRWAEKDLQQRFAGIELSLADSTFPLNRTVLDMLAELTQTELVGFDSFGNVTHSTIQIEDTTSETHRRFLFSTRNQSQRPDQVAKVEVLFDKKQIEASRRRAAILPLATGLSTIFALSTITLIVSSRLATRISKLQRRVERVAKGDFDATAPDQIDDEIGRLGGAVDSMAAQLRQLWAQINRQQSEKLLHQIAGGMAHQLRNSLTGARMAIELHAKQCDASDDDGIGVAIHQIEVSEDYVRRLLLVASGRQDEDRPMKARPCLDDVRGSLSPIAKHLRIKIHWDVDGSIDAQTILDGPTWIAAANNLIHNAMQAGDDVQIALQINQSADLRLTVSDNGPGIPDAIAADVFEPFVTSKPEGMGLGLSVVRRAAERLGGDVRWRRENDRTIFELDAKCD